jgi:SAM-dependent methyltransferase
MVMVVESFQKLAKTMQILTSLYQRVKLPPRALRLVKARYKINQLKRKTTLDIKNIAKRRQVFLEIGAGNKTGSNGWTTLDNREGADLYWDLRDGIPFPEESIDKIYTSHTFEHIPFPALQALIQECHRVLKPQGSLSVCVPNARLYIEAYISGAEFIDKSTCWQPGLCDTGSSIDQVNYTAYMGGEHCYMFDEESLTKILRLNGFNQAELRGFDLEIDLPERNHESIYALAIK